MRKTIEIKNKVISNDSLFVIAEVGNQFSGKLDVAKGLCKAAADAGADAVKFIFWFPDEIYADNPDYTYLGKDGKVTEPIVDLLNRLRLTTHEWYEVKQYCDKLGIIMISTVNCASAYDLAMDLGLPAFKLSSWDWNFTDLWDWCAKTGLPTIADMGTVHKDEVKRNVNIFNTQQNRSLVLLHCYHTEIPSEVNMRTIPYVAYTYDCLTGYSNGEIETNTDILSVGLGACVLEKRLTLNRQGGTLDDARSLEPNEFANYVKTVRDLKVRMGELNILPSYKDIELRKKYFRHIVADIDIVEGSPILRTFLDAKRGENGISPDKMEDFVGKIAKKSIKRNQNVDYTLI